MFVVCFLVFTLACCVAYEVGCSNDYSNYHKNASPIIAIEAKSLTLGKNIDAMHSVKNIPNCAAAPKIISLGLERSGPKSIIAPIPINKRSGKSSLAIPALYKVWSGSAIPAFGKFIRIAPKPMGKSKVGSMFFLMARKISTPPINPHYNHFPVVALEKRYNAVK